MMSTPRGSSSHFLGPHPATDSFQCDGCLFVSYRVGALGWVALLCQPQCRGWLSKVDASWYFREPTSIKWCSSLKRWTQESIKLPDRAVSLWGNLQLHGDELIREIVFDNDGSLQRRWLSLICFDIHLYARSFSHGVKSRQLYFVTRVRNKILQCVGLDARR